MQMYKEEFGMMCVCVCVITTNDYPRQPWIDCGYN